MGATGYTGVELLRLLAPRCDVAIAAVTSRQWQGRAVSTHFPNLRGHPDLCFSAPDDPVLQTCDVVFFATPHGTAMHQAGRLLDAGVRVIDLSADFRIHDKTLWERWYGTEHASPELLDVAVYGLPEVNREAIREASLIAVPGCYPTAVQLGFLPLLENDLVATDRLIADAKSGVSGAGRKAVHDYLFCEVAESMQAYGLGGHRHHPEISQGLELAAKSPVQLTFIPHLVPMVRGILVTLYASLKSDRAVTAAELQAIFARRYADEPFVDVLAAGDSPATRSVKGSNRCMIAVNHSGETGMLVVLVAEDNLIKGASGQAIQNLNLMFNLGESTGLEGLALLP